MPTFSCHFAFEWETVYQEQEVGSPYQYPTFTTKYMKQNYKLPAVYRWHIKIDNKSVLYVGQTNNLLRRIGNYINATSHQKTSIRIKNELQQLITQNAEIYLERMVFEVIYLNSQTITYADLSHEYVRIFLENWLLINYHAQEIELLNK